MGQKCEELGLSFPYDWSNPAISDDALIANVLERCVFADVARVCFHGYPIFMIDPGSKLPGFNQFCQC